MRTRQLAIDLALGLAVAALWHLGFEIGIGRGWQPQDSDAWLVAGASLGVAVAVRRVAGPWTLALLALAYPFVYFRPLVSYFHLMPLLVLGFANAQRSPRRPWLALASATVGVAVLFSPFVDATSRAPDDLWGALRGEHPEEVVVDEYGVSYAIPGRPPYQTNWSGLALAEFAAISVVLLGAAIASQRQVAEDLAARNEELERLRQVEADRAVADERLRISRDLHDVVAHHLTAILMRAQAADRVRASRPDEAAAAVAWIAEESRDALRATRATISSLRDDGSERRLDRDLVSDLQDIIDRVGQVGLDTRLEVRWEAEPLLAPTVGVAVRRVVQEALTNVLKHARAGQAHVVLREVRGGVGVDIVDDGSAGRTPTPDLDGTTGGGAGLVGMQERLSACGGQLRYGPVDGGGWRVRLWVPTATGGTP